MDYMTFLNIVFEAENEYIAQDKEIYNKFLTAKYNNDLNHKGKFKAFVDLANQMFANTYYKNNNSNTEVQKNKLLLSVLNKGEEKMTGITFRKDGRYSIRIMRNGVRIQKYAKTYADAKKILVSIKKPKSERTNDIILSDWLQEWFNIYKKPFLKEKTASDLSNYINEISGKIGYYRIDKIETIELQNFLNKYPKSRKKEMITQYLIAALRKASETNKTKNTSYLGIVKDKKIKSKRNALSYEQQLKLIESIKNTSLEQPILFYLMTGARKNELIRRISDISMISNIITIHGTKTEKSILRNVRVSEKYKEYLLIFMQNNRMLSAEHVNKLYSKLCKEIGIPSGLHLLRHTYASNLRVMGIDAKQTQLWLGHEDITTTLNIYTDIDETITKERLISLYNDMYIQGSQQN